MGRIGWSVGGNNSAVLLGVASFMLEPTTLTPGYFPQEKGGFTRPILNPRDRG